MARDLYPTHLSPSMRDPRGGETSRASIREAVRVLMAEHAICEMSAYTLLVHASADDLVSVRHTAGRVLTRSE